MRIASVLALLLAGCIQPPPDEPPTGDPEPGWSGPGGDPVYGCENACGSQVCARDGECYPASQVRAAHVAWTVHGATASTATCTGREDLYIAFRGSEGQYLGFAPVPCRAGGYYIDKLPTFYTRTELGTDGGNDGKSTSFDTDGEAVIDLP